jgi:hypothetical protein
MSENQGIGKSTIKQTPSSIAQNTPRVDFNDDSYNAIIEQKGYDVEVDKAALCPCKSKATHNKSTCTNCGGSGWIFYNRRRDRLVLQSMDSSKDFKEEGVWELGDVKVTGRAENKLGFMDRITVLDGETIGTQTVYFYKIKGKHIGKTIHNIKVIQELFLFGKTSQPLKALEEGVDYTVDPDDKNVITLSDEYNAKAEGLRCAIRYEHSPVYHMVALNRETMNTHIKVGSDQETDMPFNGVARRAHLIIDEENLAGTRINDNSTETSEDALLAPFNLISPSQTTTTIDLSWSYTSDGVATHFDIQRSNNGGKTFTSIAEQVIGDLTYTDSTVIIGTGYVYRVRAITGTQQSNYTNWLAVSTSGVISTDPLIANVLSGIDYIINGTPLTGTLVVPATPTGIAYARVMLSGQTVSTSNYDEAHNLANDVYDFPPPTLPLYTAQLDYDAVNPFLTLKNNNAFGTTDRFTNTVGGLVFDGTGGSVVDYIIDHLTGLGWYRVVQSAANWATSLSTANGATLGGFGGWRIPSFGEWNSMMNHAPYASSIWNQFPLNFTTAYSFWSCSYVGRLSTTFGNTVTGSNGGWAANNMVNSVNNLYCRTHYA